MRARLSIYYSKKSCEIREISLKNKPSQFIELSPKGTVPVLEIHGSHVIEESIDIVKWFLSKNDPYQLLLPNIYPESEILFSIHSATFTASLR